MLSCCHLHVCLYIYIYVYLVWRIPWMKLLLWADQQNQLIEDVSRFLKKKRDYHCVGVFKMSKYLCACPCVCFAIGHLKGALRLIASPYAQVLHAAGGRLGSRTLRLPCECLRLAITRDEHDKAVRVTPSEGASNPCLVEAGSTRQTHIHTFTATRCFETERKKKTQSWITLDRIRLWCIH